MTSSTLQRAVKLCFPSPGSVVGHFPTIDDQCVTCMIARCVTGEVYRRACKVVRRARTAQWRLESDSGSYFRAHFGIGLRHFRNDEARRDDVGPDAITPKLRRQRFSSEEHTSELQSLMRRSSAVF